MGSLPDGLEYNATSREISGVPVDGNQSVVLITARNPAHPSVQQSHLLSVFPGADFIASMSIEIDSSVVGGKPSDFAGLVAHFAADAINESNGSSITVWSDSSGYGRNLDNSRGDPKILSSSVLDGRMVVAFNGFSSSTQVMIMVHCLGNTRFLPLPDIQAVWTSQ